MMVVVFVVVVVALLWFRRRAVRKSTLSGLNGERPVFSVSPPARRLGSRKGDLL